jgi:hypothetical protein
MGIGKAALTWFGRNERVIVAIIILQDLKLNMYEKNV